MNSPGHRIGSIVIGAALMFLSSSRAGSLEPSALEQIAASLESKIFQLRIDLHEPDTSGESMQTPTLEKRGWHHHNPAGAVALRAGTRVEVTGVFNYADRGLFLELAKEQSGSREPIETRTRCRIRIMVETLPADPAGQVREATELIGKVLEAAANP